MAGCWLIIYAVLVLVGSRGRVGLVAPTPNGHLPALFGGPFRVQLGEWGFVRWIGPLDGIRNYISTAATRDALGGASPTAPSGYHMYETCN
jgi:hypothetical protein